ncbi:ead/Ea22-like family protein [Salmonella enterica]|uniref:ead/Ea22-like family protein n=1 Tax=Salmonella enterica TaxID=28901 RepID=UPI0009ADE0CF|nr:ead/Ea22-like family protein [Salmonella enterica]
MTIDKQALREAAEKATKGPYVVGHHNINQHGNLSGVYVCQQWKDSAGGVVAECHVNCLTKTSEQVYANAEFIAVANPRTMLALLDELEHYKSREERVTKLVLDNSTSWDALYKKLEAAEKRIAELTDQKATWVSWAENASGMVDMLRLRIAELEQSETQLINERDSAESALNDAYKAVMGQAPEWSNWFSFENAIDEIELACEQWRNQTDDVIQFRQRIQELEAKLETADRLQDGAFRDGLKAGFSYGQTDDQSGFTQCMSAYSTTPASLLPDGLIRAVHFYEQVKRENPPVETGAWKDAIDWVLKEARLAASTLESSREHEVISQQEKA